MSSVMTALRAVNQRLLWITAILLLAGLLWGAWVAAGSPGRGDDEDASFLGGFGGGTTGSMGADIGVASSAPAPSMDGGFAMPVEGKVQSSGEAAGGSGELTIPSVLGRTVIRTGQVQLQVESVSDAFERVRQLAEANGGFVADSTIYGGGGKDGSASLTLRVPSERFGQVMADLQALGVEVDTLSTSAQDVTEEYADLQATLRNLTAVEGQYLELLGRAESIGEVLQVQDRLNQVRLQIEQVQGRINLLDHLTTLSTISVYLTPVMDDVVEEPADGLLDSAREAWEASLETLESIARGVLVVLVFSWWLVPVLLVAGWFARRALRKRARVDTPEGQA
ncbi:MAG: hypothetical protein AMXMBFR23_13620 [Chloroflexota bacterium]